MARPLKTSLIVVLMIIVSTVILQPKDGSTLKLVNAAEALAPTQGQATSAVTENQLRQLYTERKEILEGFVKLVEVGFKAGKRTMAEYVQAKKAALLAGIDLCNKKSDRIEIHKEIVKLYVTLEEHEKRREEVGIIDEQGLREVIVARLEAEINLLRERLK